MAPEKKREEEEDKTGISMPFQFAPGRSFLKEKRERKARWTQSVEKLE